LEFLLGLLRSSRFTFSPSLTAHRCATEADAVTGKSKYVIRSSRALVFARFVKTNLQVSYSRSWFSAPTGLRPPAQGCRFGYPGKRRHQSINRNAVATALQLTRWRNRFAVGIHSRTCSQGSRNGNPGLEDIAPLGHSRQNILFHSPSLSALGMGPSSPSFHLKLRLSFRRYRRGGWSRTSSRNECQANECCDDGINRCDHPVTSRWTCNHN